MTGHDWLATLVLAAVLVGAIGVDMLRRREERRAERVARSERHRQLLNEIRRQP